MPIVKVSKIYNKKPLEIDEQGLRRLYDEITKLLVNPEVHFSLTYSDQSSIEKATLEDVIKDENRSGRKINELKMLAKSSDMEICLSFCKTKIIKGEKKFILNVSLEISGPDRQKVFLAQSVVEDRLTHFKLSRPKTFTLVISITFVFLFITVFVLQKYLNALPSVFVTLNSGTNQLGLSGFSTICVLILVVSVGSLVYSLFPNLIFLIGDEIEENHKKERLRSNLFWVVIVGFILSIAASQLLK